MDSDDEQPPQLIKQTQLSEASSEYASIYYDPHKEISSFWDRVKDKISDLEVSSLRESTRHQELPLARIKKIMKLDEDVKSQMISSEAPVILAKAAEIFIEELTVRSWLHTEESKRKTLQKCDISQAVSRFEQFDFLIDIVPREEKRNCQVPSPENETFSNHSTGNQNVQFVLQVSGSDGTLTSGSMVQATPIGQPIQLPLTSGNQPVQLIALALPDGNIQQFQVQLPTTTS